MSETAAFDGLAKAYDLDFTGSRTGFHQRRISRKWLMRFLQDQPALKILEINCGTGDDALWLASMGHTVVATDQSPEMIKQAALKSTANHSSPEFLVCEFGRLKEKFQTGGFDLVFSNFSGLNCLSPSGLESLAKDLRQMVRPGGHLAMVVFGKYCCWESLYFLLKAHPSQAFRRWGGEKKLVQLDQDHSVPVYYHSVRRIRKGTGWKLVEAKPVGLFIPPSYLENFIRKKSRLFSVLVKLEEHFGVGLAASLADHTYLLFKNQP